MCARHEWSFSFLQSCALRAPLSAGAQGGSLMRGSELSLLWQHLCEVIIPQFVCCPPGAYGISFYCDCTPSMSCGFSFVFEYRISVLVSFMFFCCWGGGSPVSCDFGVFLIWCELTSFCSTILCQGPALFQNHIQFFHLSYIIYA